LVEELRSLILKPREGVAQAVNSTLMLLYWQVGHRIRTEVLKQKRATYGEEMLPTLSAKLAGEFGEGFSARNLARLFAEHANCSPLDYVQLIRFALARQLVTQSRLDLERVAMRAGFRSAQHLRRVWSRWEARPPSALRARDLEAA
jgi:transcriptional regulator GlxA family with amidase domain